MSNEQTFFSKDGVRVTDARFIVHGETYSMANITSVKTDKETPERTGPIATLGIGVLSFLFGEFGVGFYVVGVILVIVGVAWWKGQSPTYSLLLSSASGEVKALASQNKDFIDKVEQSINEAIVARG